MTSDLRTGVVAVTRTVHIMMEEDDCDMRKALIRKLNYNLNKYYPYAGGILMGCEGIQLKLNTMEVNITTLLHPIQVRAKFYLFRPQVGAELMCVITKMEEAGIRCLAHGMFEVKVFGPLGCSEMA